MNPVESSNPIEFKFVEASSHRKHLTRTPLSNPKSKSSYWLSKFLKLPIQYPSDFPLQWMNSKVSDRLREVMGVPQPAGSKHTKPPYMIKGRRPYAWLSWVEDKLGSHIVGKFLMGSAASYVAGQEVLYEALKKLETQLTEDVHESLLKRIPKRNFVYNDVDFRIKVMNTLDLESVCMTINETSGELAKAKYYPETNTLRVWAEDESGNKIDFFIYSHEPHCAFNTDDWIVDLAEEKVTFLSSNPWSWWLGNTFKLIVKGKDENPYLFPRLVKKEVYSYTTFNRTESEVIKSWLNVGIIPHQEGPLIPNLLWHLRVQQLILENCRESSFMQKVTKVNAEAVESRFLYEFFNAMRAKGTLAPYLHAMLECIGVVALCEGWASPFEARLTRNGTDYEKKKSWHIRIRIQKHDLLVRFDPSASLEKLKSAPEKLRPYLKRVLHSFWLDGITLRELDPIYKHRVKNKVTDSLLTSIKKVFLWGVKDDHAEYFVLSENETLASYLIPLCNDPKELFWIGCEVLENYGYDRIRIQKLCNEVVQRCLICKGWEEAANLIIKLKNDSLVTDEVLPKYFSKLLVNDVTVESLKECTPWQVECDWNNLIKLPPSLRVFKFIEGIEKVEEYLEAIALFEVTPLSVSEEMLIRINSASWFEKHDKPSYKSSEYCAFLSSHIENLSPEKIVEVLLSGRYIGSSFEISKYVIGLSIETAKKSEVLTFFQIKDEFLWSQIFGEYLAKNEKWPSGFTQGSSIPEEILTQWCTVIEKAQETSVVIPLIERLKDSASQKIRSVVLGTLLSKWNQNTIDIRVIQALDTNHLPWDIILYDANRGDTILSNLSKIPGRTSAFLFFKLFSVFPRKDEKAFNWFLAKIQEVIKNKKPADAVAICKHRHIVESLKINPLLARPLLKQLVCVEGVSFILQFAINCKFIDVELFKLLMRSAMESEDEGFLCNQVLDANSKKNINDTNFLNEILIYSEKLLKSSKGNLHTIGKLWNFISWEIKITAFLPSSVKLLALLRKGYFESVAKMLHFASKEQLRSVEPIVFSILLRKPQNRQVTLDFNQRNSVLKMCRVSSDHLKIIWKEIATHPDLSHIERLDLIESARFIGIPIEQMQKIASEALIKVTTKFVFKDEIIQSVLELLDSSDTPERYALWEALQYRISPEKLWKVGVDILRNNLVSPPKGLIAWIIKNRQPSDLYLFYELIPDLFDRMPKKNIQMIVNDFLKPEAVRGNRLAEKLYWEYVTNPQLTLSEVKGMEIKKEATELILNMIGRLVEKSPSKLLVPKILEICSIQKYLHENKPIIDKKSELLIATIVFLVDNFSFAEDQKRDFINYLANFIILTFNEEGQKSQAISIKLEKAKELLFSHIHFLDESTFRAIVAAIISNHFSKEYQWKFISMVVTFSDEYKVNLVLDVLESKENIQNLQFKTIDYLIKFSLNSRKRTENLRNKVNASNLYLFNFFILKADFHNDMPLEYSESYMQSFGLCASDLIAHQMFEEHLIYAIDFIFYKDREENKYLLELLIKILSSQVFGRYERIWFYEYLVQKIHLSRRLPLDMIEVIFMNAQSQLKSSLEGDIVPVLLFRLQRIIETLCRSIFFKDSFQDVKENLDIVIHVVENLPLESTNYKSLLISKLLLFPHHNFFYNLNRKDLVESIQQVISDITLFDSKLAADHFHVLVCNLTYHILFEFPEALKFCNEIFVENFLRIYGTQDFHKLFTHLLAPAENEKDVFLKSKLRIELIYSNIIKLLDKDSQILPNLILYILKSNIVKYYISNEESWVALLVVLGSSCRKLKIGVKEFTLLLSTFPEDSMTQKWSRYLKDKKFYDLKLFLDLSHSMNISNQDFEYYPHLTLFHHLKGANKLHISTPFDELSAEDVFLHVEKIFHQVSLGIPFIKETSVCFPNNQFFLSHIEFVLSKLLPCISSNPQRMMNFVVSLVEAILPFDEEFHLKVAFELRKCISSENLKLLKDYMEKNDNPVLNDLKILLCYDNNPTMYTLINYLRKLTQLHRAKNLVSPIHYSSSFRRQFNSAYIGILELILDDLRIKKNNEQFVLHLIMLRQETDKIIDSMKLNQEGIIEGSLDLFFGNAQYLQDKRVVKEILLLLEYQFYNMHNSFSVEAILKSLKRATIFALLYGPANPHMHERNKFQVTHRQLGKLYVRLIQTHTVSTIKCSAQLGFIECPTYNANLIQAYDTAKEIYKSAIIELKDDIDSIDCKNPDLAPWLNYWRKKINDVLLAL